MLEDKKQLQTLWNTSLIKARGKTENLLTLRAQSCPQKATLGHSWASRILHFTPRRSNNGFYKITKIVCAPWLAERSVNMRLCKHGCGVKMFCFSRANYASTSLKKFSSSKLDEFALFTHFWNLENRCKESVSIFFRLSWHFKREKSVFWKASFCKTRTNYACKTSWTRLCDW